MLIPIRCFTCHKSIAQDWEAFQEAVRPSPGTDARSYFTIEVDPETQEIHYNGEKKTPAERFFEEKGYTRWCCRRMFPFQPENLENDILHQNPSLARIVHKN